MIFAGLRSAIFNNHVGQKNVSTTHLYAQYRKSAAQIRPGECGAGYASQRGLVAHMESFLLWGCLPAVVPAPGKDGLHLSRDFDGRNDPAVVYNARSFPAAKRRAAGVRSTRAATFPCSDMSSIPREPSEIRMTLV